MEGTTTPPPPPEENLPPTTSLVSRLFNIFATPGDVFDEVKASPVLMTNWLVPLVVNCVLGIISVVIIFSQPAIFQKYREQQDKEVEKQIARGNMPKQQADQTRAMMEKIYTPPLMIVLGSVGKVILSTGWLFTVALVMWALTSFVFKAPGDYLKVVEVAGLASMISVLGIIIQTLLVVAKCSMYASLSPSLFIHDFDPGNFVHGALSLLNVMMLWYLAVISIGLQKLGNTTFVRAAGCVYGLWAVCGTALVLFGVVMKRVTAHM